MNQEIQDLLEQLKNQTGIAFSIENQDLDEKQTASVLKNMLHAQYNSTSKEGFLRSLLLGVYSPEEIIKNCHQFHMERHGLFFPFLIETKQPISSMEQSIFYQYFSSGADILIPIDDCHICILRSLKQELSFDDLLQTMEDIHLILEGETLTSINLSYDQICTSIDQLPAAFLSISTAMEIGTSFYPTQHVFWAHDLGMGKLIYHLPKEICQEYIKDHFQGLQVNLLDEETLHTIHVFLESGLNIAECARNLYLHRNTLIYRLDKIQKLTGLDIRRFDHAMTCKVAMMMSQYLLLNS